MCLQLLVLTAQFCQTCTVKAFDAVWEVKEWFIFTNWCLFSFTLSLKTTCIPI